MRRMAYHIISKHGFSLPMDIEHLLSEYADVDYFPWEMACDAVVSGLTQKTKPRVIVKKVPSSLRRRQRFTMAHELGHITLAWHTGQTLCTPSSSNEHAGNHQADTHEIEANEFAGEILMPFGHLSEIGTDKTLSQLFEYLNHYDLSPSATVLRLSKILRPGFIFVGQFAASWNRITSVGTAQISSEALSSESFESGNFEVDGRQIQWYRTANYVPLVVDDDDRKNHELLADALLDCGESILEVDSRIQKIEGAISGALSKKRYETWEWAYSHIRQWIIGDSRFVNLRNHPDFDLFLRRKTLTRTTRMYSL